MHLPWLNRAQRIVVVIGFGAALYVVGAWLSTPGFPMNSGWVGYAPLSSSFARARLTGLADLVVWFTLTALWVLGSAYLLRTRASDHDSK